MYAMSLWITTYVMDTGGGKGMPSNHFEILHMLPGQN